LVHGVVLEMPEHHFWVVLAFGALVLVLQNGFGYITARLSLIVIIIISIILIRVIINNKQIFVVL